MAALRDTIEYYNNLIDSDEYWVVTKMLKGGPNNPDEQLTPSGRVYRNLPPDGISLECVQTSGNNLDCLIHSFLMATCPAFRRRIRMGVMGVTDECGAKQFATYFRTVCGPTIVDAVYSSYAAGRNDRLSRVIAQARENAKKDRTSEEDMIKKQIAAFERGERGKSQRDPIILKKELTGSDGLTDLADDHLLTFATYFNISVLLFREFPLVIRDTGLNTYMISNPHGGHFEAVRTMNEPRRFFLPYNNAIKISRAIMGSGKQLKSFTEESSQLDSRGLRAMAPAPAFVPAPAPAPAPPSDTKQTVAYNSAEMKASSAKMLQAFGLPPAPALAFAPAPAPALAPAPPPHIRAKVAAKLAEMKAAQKERMRLITGTTVITGTTGGRSRKQKPRKTRRRHARTKKRRA